MFWSLSMLKVYLNYIDVLVTLASVMEMYFLLLPENWDFTLAQP